MRLLIDSNVDNNLVTAYLLDGTHEVLTIRALNLVGDSGIILKEAYERKCTLICFKNKQYRQLHIGGQPHHGIIRVPIGLPKEVGPILLKYLATNPTGAFCETLPPPTGYLDLEEEE